MIVVLSLMHYGLHSTNKTYQYPPQEKQHMLNRPPNTEFANLSYQQQRYKHYPHFSSHEVCTYKQIFGTCLFKSFEYINDRDDALKVVVEFSPFLHYQTIGDLNSEYKVQDDYQSASFFEENNILPGQIKNCWRKTTDQRNCMSVNWGIEDIDE